MRCRKVPGGQAWHPMAHWILVQLRKDPDVVARVLEEFDPSGTQDRAGKVELGGFVLAF